MPSFNLVDEKWLPVLDSGGSPVELSIREALRDAHLLREIYGETPLMTLALNRFMQAIAIRIFNLTESDDDWFEVWEAGRFDPEKIDEYFEDWKDRFDLFDEERPFYQHREKLVKNSIPYGSMLLEFASANNPTLFDHNFDNKDFAVSAADLARTLVTAQAYSLQGGVSKPFNFANASMISGVVFWINERSLFKNLTLNSCPVDVEFDPDNLKWESEKLIRSELRHPKEYADYLTWQSRRFLYVLKNDNQNLDEIRKEDFEVYRCMGDKIDGYFRDPLFAFRKGKDMILPYRYRIEKSLWRDSSVVFSSFTEDEGGGPRNLDALSYNVQEMGYEEDYDFNLEAYGVINDQGKMVLWRNEKLPFFPNIKKDPSKSKLVSKILDFADKQAQFIYFAGMELGKQILYPGTTEEGRQLSKDGRAEAKNYAEDLNIETNYWPKLENLFYEALDKIAHTQNHEEFSAIVDQWLKDIFRAALDAYDTATSHLNANATQLKAVVIARRFIHKVKTEEE